jgi:hypothetical protein
MSADNFVIVRQFSDGWRWAMGAASCDEDIPDERFVSHTFDNPWDASDDAANNCEIIEYGVEIERPRF